MRLVEAVVRELVEQVPDLLGLRLADAVVGGALQEQRLLRVHLGLDLLAHGAAQQIGAAEGEARELAGDLHHLLLIDDDALRLVEDAVDRGVQALALLAAVLDVAELRDVLHRAGAVERDERDDVLDAGGLELAERGAHARALHLEHRDRVGGGVDLVGLRVVERDRPDVEADAARLQEVDGVLDHRQRLQAEKVELHQPRFLDPLHVELGRRHVRARVAVERHQLVERPVADDDASGVGRGVAQQALDGAGDLEQPGDLRLAAGLLAQPRLVGERLLDRDGLHAFDRDQLGEPVDLAVGHLQHAADVADRGLGQERAEGDDLRDAVAAVALLDVGDHLLAAVHAEVDVEVRHRDAVGVQEPLEEQAVAQRVEVGDGERVGDERARAGAAAGADGDVARLGPLDEVGDDEEVAGEAHALDDAELELEPFAVRLDRRRVRDHREPDLKALARLAAQLLDLVLGELRQDRLALPWPVGAAPGDLDRVGDRLRQVGEERGHLVGALEAVLGRQAPPRLLLVDIGAVGDADQGVVGIMHRTVGELYVVGRDERQVEVVGETDEPGLGRLLERGARRAVLRMPLHLDVEPPREERGEALGERPGARAVALADQLAERALGAAGQADQSLGVGGERLERHVRQLGAAPEVVERGELHQVEKAGRVLGEEHDRPRRRRPLARMRGGGVGEGELAAHDRLDAGLGGDLGEFERREEVAGVGQRHRGHASLGAELRQRLHRDGALEQRIGGVQAEVDESGLGHSRDRSKRRGRRNRRQFWSRYITW